MRSQIKFKRISKFNYSALNDLNNLYSQLSFSNFKKQISAGYLKKILKDKNVYLCGLYDGKRIIGTGTIILMQPLGGIRAYLDAMVVDEAYRGQGLGKMIINELLKTARKLKAQRMEFTSRPARKAANALYKKTGFKQRETNVYEKKL
ncbi:GNAT family N-acetyltransferase [Candidatus Wolfebacteria bacterium]|nr:GNAT family N-acetyltransferase [Candidatus Wolfebacteria bacterium]